MSAVPDQAVAVEIDDDKKLEELGYIPSFKREFSDLATASRLSKGFLLPTSDEPRRNPPRLALHLASWYSLRTEAQKNKPLIGLCAGRVSAPV